MNQAEMEHPLASPGCDKTLNLNPDSDPNPGYRSPGGNTFCNREAMEAFYLSLCRQLFPRERESLSRSKRFRALYRWLSLRQDYLCLFLSSWEMDVRAIHRACQIYLVETSGDRKERRRLVDSLARHLKFMLGSVRSKESLEPLLNVLQRQMTDLEYLLGRLEETEEAPASEGSTDEERCEGSTGREGSEGTASKAPREEGADEGVREESVLSAERSECAPDGSKELSAGDKAVEEIAALLRSSQ